MTKAESARIKLIGHLVAVVEEGTGEDAKKPISHRTSIEIAEHLRKELGYADQIIEDSTKLTEDSPFMKQLKEDGIINPTYIG
jgi:hypothetical protein